MFGGDNRGFLAMQIELWYDKNRLWPYVEWCLESKINKRARKELVNDTVGADLRDWELQKEIWAVVERK